MPVLDKANISEVKRYDEFTRKSPYGKTTQDRSWAEVKKEWLNEQVYVERNGEIVAAMSLLIRKFFNTYSLIYAPRGPVCDIYDKELVEELMREVDKLAKEYRAFAVRFDPEVIYDKELAEEYEKLGYRVKNYGFEPSELIQPRYNMILDIEGLDEEEVMAKFSRKTRYNVRLAGRRGVEISHHTSDEALEIFYDIYKVTTARNEIGQRNLQYFKDMRDAYGDKLRIYLGKHEDDYISGAITINYGKKVWYVYGASTNNKRNHMPNYLMQMEMIKWGLETGASEYDFGGVLELDNSDGLYRFKEGFCREDGVTEFIGEFDKVYKPFIYKGFTKVIPYIQQLVKKIRRD